MDKEKVDKVSKILNDIKQDRGLRKTAISDPNALLEEYGVDTTNLDSKLAQQIAVLLQYAIDTDNARTKALKALGPAVERAYCAPPGGEVVP